MKPLYIATSKQLSRTRSFKQMVRLMERKCTRAITIKLFKDKYGSISMNSEPIGTLLRVPEPWVAERIIAKLRKSKRLTIEQLYKWKMKEEVIDRIVVAEMEAATGWTRSIH